MRKKNYKGRCEKRQVSKCEDVCRTYDAIQRAYLDRLEANRNIKSIRCNVTLKGPTVEEYTTDFVCIRADGEMMVRECVFRRFLTKRNAPDIVITVRGGLVQEVRSTNPYATVYVVDYDMDSPDEIAAAAEARERAMLPDMHIVY